MDQKWDWSMVMSLLIRYAYIPFYFCFSITSSTLSIHHNTPLHQHDCTHTRFISPISLIWWTHVIQFTCFVSILSIPNVHPPTVRPIMNPCTMWSGTYSSFALDEPYACFLVDHLYLTYLYLPFKTENFPYEFPPEFRISTYTLYHITFTPHLFALHHTAL